MAVCRLVVDVEKAEGRKRADLGGVCLRTPVFLEPTRNARLTQLAVVTVEDKEKKLPEG